MQSYKKTIILTNKENKSNDIATLNLEQKSNGIFGRIKYFGNENGDYVLGIKSGNEIYKQNIKIDNKEYSFILSKEIKLNENIGCVLCTYNDGILTPKLWGNEKTENYKNQIIKNLNLNFQKLEKNTTNIKVDSTQILKNISQNQNHTPYPTENKKAETTTTKASQKQNIEDTITLDNIINFNEKIEKKGYACETFKYNNFSNNKDYQQMQIDDNILDTAYATKYKLFESDEEEIEKTIDAEINSNTTHDFYDMISEQLQELFDKYPSEDNLSKIIEESKWCKISRDFDNNTYVVGVIYKDNDIRYICYGVPGRYDIQPPREMQGYSQWLPTDTLDPYNNGYWVMYQDADTGENIYLN